MEIWLNILSGLVVVGLFGVLSYKIKIVSISGLVAGLIVGLLVWIFGGWSWFIIILSFHLSAAFFTKFKYKRKEREGLAQAKGGSRGWPNVMANGGFPTICATLEGLFVLLSFYGEILLFGFLGSVATMTADTIATEVGLLSKTPPRLVTNLKKNVEPGTSGGITILGELGALSGTIIIGGLAWLFAGLKIISTVFTYQLLIVAISAGMFGCFVDSLLGASIQGIFQCNICKKITEKAKHCGEKSTHQRGFAFFENNMVNFVSASIGGLTAMILFFIF
ncbi:MAG: TIGR00297 family protein [Promethearchaeota archaeon]